MGPDLDVYFKLTDFNQYIVEGDDPEKYSYQDEFKIFACPTRGCSNITDLVEIQNPKVVEN